MAVGELIKAKYVNSLLYWYFLNIEFKSSEVEFP